ncbi:MAG TPA: hypothetical protein VLT62_16050 [Candidatus Methylomirabilis sp.]|nr:hypothetical protein [Candidatus Methylomirabilis sp.]
MSKKLRLAVLGILGRTPFAGVAWQVMHYLEGFRRLGHHVYYVEDTGDWPYDPEQRTVTADCRYTVTYIARLMARCGLADRWAYRAGAQGGRTFGLSDTRLSCLFSEVDALINLTGSTQLRDDHLRVPVRIYLETDPVRPQIEVAQGRQFTIDLLSAHTHHFTYGENFGAPDCCVPLGRFHYFPTRQPIVLDWWTSTAGPLPDACPHSRAASRFTSIANWQQSGRDLEWNGETYSWSKHLEFLKFIDLPRRTGQSLELALACEDPEAIQLLASHGWRVVDAVILSKDILPYRDYILGSLGEFTVAKDQNIRLRSGWFSDRSACYLAAAKPVVTQETGFGNVLPTGKGLFSFTTMEEIVAALEAISADCQTHSRAARAIAEEYFKAETVLSRVLGEAGL